MKAKRILLLVMATCLAGGARAQFYDSADDIYYYVEDKDKLAVLIFNFNGERAALLNLKKDGIVAGVSSVRDNIKENPNFYEDKVEVTEYDMKYNSSNTYSILLSSYKWLFRFSTDRQECYLTIINGKDRDKLYKRVDKSFFKIGRSRTPSGTMYE